MIDLIEQTCGFSYRNGHILHTYYAYRDQNIFFCNIPKCASQSIREHIEKYQVRVDEPYYFTVIRNPIERLFSALWMIGYLTNEIHFSNRPGSYPPSINNFVREVNAGTAFTGNMTQYYMHCIPQTDFINNFPYASGDSLKIFRMDQVNNIFNAEIECKNRRVGTYEAKDKSQWDPVFRSFADLFNQEIVEHRSFINNFYKDDIALWEKVNESK